MRPSGAVLGVDVGGTGIKARLTDADGLVLDERRVPTPQGDPQAVALTTVVVDLVRTATTVAAAHGSGLDAVGLVVPGVVDEHTGTVVLAVNLGWQDVPVRERVRAALRQAGLDTTLVFGHDVRAGALAETETGALSRGSVAFVPVGTGLASALVVDGVVVTGDGWAGEIGQVRIQHGPHAGRRVEEIASASGVARAAGTTTAQAAVERMRAGDPVAARAWDDCVDVLADALAALTSVAGCHTLVIGGGLAESGSTLLDPLARALARRLPGIRLPRLVRARHGDAAGAIGAAVLARRAVRDGVPA